MKCCICPWSCPFYCHKVYNENGQDLFDIQYITQIRMSTVNETKPAVEAAPAPAKARTTECPISLVQFSK